jgi:hypothetical protein
MRWRPADIKQIARARRAEQRTAATALAMCVVGGMDAAAAVDVGAGADTAGARNLCVMSYGRR